MIKAKDTVIKCDTSLTCCLDCHEAQAEVSFKAGVREVMEWVDANVHWREDAPYKSTIDPDEWQAFKDKLEVK